jgi:hypothetical protein
MKGDKRWGVLIISVFGLLLTTADTEAAEFTVTRPGKISIPREIEKVFIDPDRINDTRDHLNLKYEVVVALKRRLNDLGRFQVIIGPPQGFDPNRETVGFIQGDVISGGEIDQGQLTEKAECRGGVSGIVGSATAASRTDQGITLSRRGMLCKKPDLTSRLVEKGVASGLSMLGINEFPRVDEVVRVYRYKNFSLFAQVNLSFTQLGVDRDTLAIRSDAASFSRHVIDPGSFRNVRESGDNAPLIWLWFRVTPIAPVVIRDIGVVSATNPDSALGRWYQFLTPEIKDLDPAERQRIIADLANRTLDQFIQSISPYPVVIRTELASGGIPQARRYIEAGEYLEARQLLRGATEAPDLYHLGLTFEAGAKMIEDYEDALRYYGQALDKDPKNRLYAQGIGRMEFQLKTHRQASTANRP